MIRKIIALKGIGRFERFSAYGDIEFSKYTLIYAENGVGKTTLCDVIRSLQTGNPDYVIGRRTLGTSIDPEAKIQLSNGAIAQFMNGKWSSSLNGVTIFDANYVRDNIHAAEVVEVGHRRNMFQVIVGEEGVRLAKRVEELETERSNLNAPLRAARQSIEMVVPKSMSLEGFLNLEDNSSIDTEIIEAQQAQAAAEKADQVRQYRDLSPLLLPSLPETFLSTLSTSLEDVSITAEQLLHENITHLAHEDAQSWLSRGLHFTKNNRCPFCAQDISDSALVQAYQACFSKAYRAISIEVASLREWVEKNYGDLILAKMEAILAQNADAIRFWSLYCKNISLPEISFDEIKAALNKASVAAFTLIKMKEEKLLEPACDPENSYIIKEFLSKASCYISEYNTAVKDASMTIARRKSSMEGIDLDLARQKVDWLIARKKRYEEPVSAACQSYQDVLVRRKELEREKESARRSLDEYTNSIIERHEASLSRHLENFATGFRIRGMKTEYPRGLPSSTYQIVINGTPVELGTGKTSHAEPSFRNTLSAGDRSALALSLFMTQIEHTSTPPNIAVILDDPFQSQDAFRRTATAFRIKRCGDRCGQVIVLSHDAGFLKQVWELLPSDERKMLHLHSAGRTTVLAEWDIYEHMKETLLADIHVVQRFIDLGEGKSRDVAQKLRPILEGYCKNFCPGLFTEATMMGDIIRTVRSSGYDHPLFAALSEIEELNEYARRYHHTNASAAFETLNEGELRGYCYRLLRLMKVRRDYNEPQML